MIQAKGYAGFDATSPLRFYEFNRRTLGEHDVHIEIKYCGICHSDIHSVRNEWKGANYPLVPGHEIVGIVKKVGDLVKDHKEGDVVGVGCLVNSCGECSNCHSNLEQYCPKGVYTYNSVDKDGTYTMGGYSNSVVVNEKFVLKIPKNLNLPEVAPLLCAGITTYSPLKYWKIGKGHTIAVVGLGGLGHMAVKLARSFGAHVVVFTTSAHKKNDALKIGAQEVVLSTPPEEMAKNINRFDFIIDTIAAPHDVNTYLTLLKNEKTLCMLGISPEAHHIDSSSIVFKRKCLSGSLIGGIAETQEMLDYCGQQNITCDIELIPIQKVNEAYERVLKGDVKYRFVIDMQSL